VPCAVLIVRQWAIAQPLPVVLRVVVGLLLSVCGCRRSVRWKTALLRWVLVKIRATCGVLRWCGGC
jgi:hypothetical protein